MVILSPQLNILLLEEDESYLIDVSEVTIRIAYQCNSSIKETGVQPIHTQYNKKIQSMSTPPPTFNHFNGIARLCSKSLLLQPSDCSNNHIIKITFDSIQECAINPTHPYDIRDQNAAKQQLYVPLLTLTVIEIVQISVSVINGYMRVVSPYETQKAISGDSWCIQLQPANSLHFIPFNKIEPLTLLHTDMLLQTPTHAIFIQVAYTVIQLFLFEHSTSKENFNGMSFSNAVQLIIKAVPALSSFPSTLVVDHREMLLLENHSIRAELQHPLYTTRGTLVLTNKALYFRSHPAHTAASFERFLWTDLCYGIRRMANLSPIGVGLLYAWKKGGTLNMYESREVLLLFDSENTRESVIHMIEKQRPGIFKIIQNPDFLNHFTTLWKQYNFDTYHYLGLLNFLSGRSHEDFSQYLIMPWTFINFSSNTVDLTNPNYFRDLTLPIGALNDKTLKTLQTRMDDLEKSSIHAGIGPLRFLFGSHYSTAGYVVYWLVREMPECQLRLQSGRVDTWPRLFHSISETWNNLIEGQATSCMELIPNFYNPSSTSFLENRLGVNVSAPTIGSEKSVNPKTGVLSDVELPPWANGSATNFLKILREGLECPISSETMHHWIDLIFGYKQRGFEAEKANNMYHPVTYLTSCVAQGGPEADRAVSDMLSAAGGSQEAMLTQIREFGQAPIQLFTTPHPQRLSLNELKDIKEFKHDLPNLKNIKELIQYSRSSVPWFVYLLQHPNLLPSFCKKYDHTPDSSISASPRCLTPIDLSRQETSQGSYNDLGVPFRFKKNQLYHIPKLKDASITSFDSYHQNIVFGCHDGILRQFSLDNINQKSNNKQFIPVSSSEISSISCLSDTLSVIGDASGSLCIVGNENQTVTQFPSVMFSRTTPHADSILGIATTLDSSSSLNQTIFTVSLDQVLGYWDLNHLRLITNTDCPVQSPVISAIDNLVLVGGRFGKVLLWDTRCIDEGPVWIGQLHSETGGLHNKITSCNLTNLFKSRTFSAIAFSTIQLSNDHNLLNTSSNNQLQTRHSHHDSSSYLPDTTNRHWEAVLWDIRMLTGTTVPCLNNKTEALISRFSWKSDTFVTEALCDGERWAVSVGQLLSYSPPPIPDEISLSDSPTNINPYTFASVADLSEGFNSKEVCRWPLQLNTSPSFIAPSKTWHLGHHETEGCQLWFGDRQGHIELVF